MTIHNLILTSIILILFSCCTNNSANSSQIKSDTNSRQSNNLPEAKVDTLVNAMEQYAEIIRIIQKGNTAFIDVDYIQFLTGDAAIEAAKKVHEADTFVTKDGKIEFAVLNDYFIVNESKKIRQLLVSKDCVFDLIMNPDRLHPISGNSLKSLLLIYKDSPFILTLNDKGVIVKIKEVFVP